MFFMSGQLVKLWGSHTCRDTHMDTQHTVLPVNIFVAELWEEGGDVQMCVCVPASSWGVRACVFVQEKDREIGRV